MPRDWRAAVGNLSEVGKLVHLAMRQDAFDEEALRGTLVRASRDAYNDELGILAARMGCRRQGVLRTGPILSKLNATAKMHSESIVRTFNYDLATAIQHIRSEVPTANRHVYAYRLKEWAAARAEWKNLDIEMMTELDARSVAQQDFVRYNGLQGWARLVPTTAVCPICQGWIARGRVPLRIAMNHPPPYHNKCPHLWDIHSRKVSREECGLLWMGE